MRWYEQIIDEKQNEIGTLRAENDKLKVQIKKMKCCDNCFFGQDKEWGCTHKEMKNRKHCNFKLWEWLDDPKWDLLIEES